MRFSTVAHAANCLVSYVTLGYPLTAFQLIYRFHDFLVSATLPCYVFCFVGFSSSSFLCFPFFYQVVIKTNLNYHYCCQEFAGVKLGPVNI